MTACAPTPAATASASCSRRARSSPSRARTRRSRRSRCGPAVLPALLGRLPPEEELRRANDRSAAAVQALVETAQAEGTLRPDAAFADTWLLLVPLSCPLHGPPQHA